MWRAKDIAMNGSEGGVVTGYRENTHKKMWNSPVSESIAFSLKHDLRQRWIDYVNCTPRVSWMGLRRGHCLLLDIQTIRNAAYRAYLTFTYR